MSGVGDYEGWRWIFIVEGLITIIGALACYIFIVDWPEKAKFLNDQERALLLRRILEDEAEAIMDRFDKKSAVRVFSDWKIYIGYVIHPYDSYPIHEKTPFCENIGSFKIGVANVPNREKKKYIDVPWSDQHRLCRLFLFAHDSTSTGLDLAQSAVHDNSHLLLRLRVHRLCQLPN